MGHRDVVDVFACDLSLQGLIVMESMGWLNWLQNDPRFDSDRIAAIGNSGGGTLTLFLGALRRDDLAAVSSSGYPSTFDYIARKEKKHCHCNLVPHVVGELEMWQVYGCIAPKPLLLLQGSQDHFFPGDLFRHVARKTATAYALQSAPESIEVRLMDGEHRWDLPRRVVLAEFLCRSLSVPFDPELVKEDDELRGLPNCIQEWPAEALSADGLARQLSGHRGKPALNLSEVFPPQGFDPACMNAETRQIAAQYEAFLKVGLPGFPRGSRRDEAE